MLRRDMTADLGLGGRIAHLVVAVEGSGKTSARSEGRERTETYLGTRLTEHFVFLTFCSRRPDTTPVLGIMPVVSEVCAIELKKMRGEANEECGTGAEAQLGASFSVRSLSLLLFSLRVYSQRDKRGCLAILPFWRPGLLDGNDVHLFCCRWKSRSRMANGILFWATGNDDRRTAKKRRRRTRDDMHNTYTYDIRTALLAFPALGQSRPVLLS